MCVCLFSPSPNIPGRPAISYEFDLMAEYLAAISSASSAVPVGVKLTPYFSDHQFEGAAHVLNGPHKPRFVTSINTIGMGMGIDIDTETSVLSPAAHGGIGGTAVHACALGNVYQLRKRLDPAIDIAGVGGVDSGAAAFRMLLAGASVVEMATNLLHKGAAEGVKTVSSELEDIMKSKGYTSVDEFRGKVKVE